MEPPPPHLEGQGRQVRWGQGQTTRRPHESRGHRSHCGIVAALMDDEIPDLAIERLKRLPLVAEAAAGLSLGPEDLEPMKDVVARRLAEVVRDRAAEISGPPQ